MATLRLAPLLAKTLRHAHGRRALARSALRRLGQILGMDVLVRRPAAQPGAPDHRGGLHLARADAMENHILGHRPDFLVALQIKPLGGTQRTGLRQGVLRAGIRGRRFRFGRLVRLDQAEFRQLQQIELHLLHRHAQRRGNLVGRGLAAEHGGGLTQEPAQVAIEFGGLHHGAAEFPVGRREEVDRRANFIGPRDHFQQHGVEGEIANLLERRRRQRVEREVPGAEQVHQDELVDHLGELGNPLVFDPDAAGANGTLLQVELELPEMRYPREDKSPHGEAHRINHIGQREIVQGTGNRHGN